LSALKKKHCFGLTLKGLVFKILKKVAALRCQVTLNFVATKRLTGRLKPAALWQIG